MINCLDKLKNKKHAKAKTLTPKQIINTITAMTQISVDTTKQTLLVEVTSKSLHALGFKIRVFDPVKNTDLDIIKGDTKSNNPFRCPLKLQLSEYKGCFIYGTFTFQSVNGDDDQPYQAEFSVYQDNAQILPFNTITGSTEGGIKSVFSDFHLN